MRIKSTQNRERKILKSLKYLVLTAAILIGATGVSNANPFTVTATVPGCDPVFGLQQATITSVSATVEGEAQATTIDFGSVARDFEKDIVFTIAADGAIDCDNTETAGSITIEFTDFNAIQALTNEHVDMGFSGTFSTDVTTTTVTFDPPNVSSDTNFSETITFSISP
jgi:hypothetical protein